MPRMTNYIKKGNDAASGSLVVSSNGHQKHQIIAKVTTPAAGTMTVKVRNTLDNTAGYVDLPTPVTVDLSGASDLVQIEAVGEIELAWTGFTGASFDVSVDSYD